MILGKKALVIGAVGVGGIILYELFKPGSTVLRPSSTASKQQANGNWVSGLIAPIASALTNVLAPSGAAATGAAAAGQAATPTFFNSQAAYNANYGDPNYVNVGGNGYSAGAVNNYAYADTHPGTALPAGVFGPPVPTNVTSGDDGLISPDSYDV